MAPKSKKKSPKWKQAHFVQGINSGKVMLKKPRSRKPLSAAAQLQKQLAKTPTTIKSAICFNKKARCYQLNGKNMTGLTKVLHRVVLPNGMSTQMMSLRCGSVAKASAPASASEQLAEQQSFGKARKARRSKNPLAKGKRIHQDLDNWFKSGDAEPKTGNVAAILTCLRAHGLHIVETEAGCGWESINLATGADIVCKDKHGFIVIVELKTTQSTIAAIKAHQISFKAPFHALPGSLMSVYMLQALATELLYEKNHPTSPVVESFVLLLRNDCTATMHPLPQEVKSLKGRLAEALCAPRM
jgi:hypothetical protein